jgi:hypothetical protein
LSVTTTVIDRTVPASSVHPGPNYPIVDRGNERIKRGPILGGLINEYLPAA